MTAAAPKLLPVVPIFCNVERRRAQAVHFRDGYRCKACGRKVSVVW